jgi:hypothetical protein
MGELNWRAKGIGTIAEFFSVAECDEWIRVGGSEVFEDVPITTGRGPVMMKEVRNNDRVMFDDGDRARDLYRRLSPHLAPCFKKGWEPVAVNERLRLYRYDVGQEFGWHPDGCFERPTGDRSFFTFMVYLKRGRRLSIPNLAPLPLHGDAGGIADLEPAAARAGLIGAVDSLGNDALSAKPAGVCKDDRAVLGDVFVEQNVCLGVAQQSRQRGLAVQERETAHILAVMLDQVEGIE